MVIGTLMPCRSHCGKTDAPALGRWGKVWRLSSKVDVGLNLNGDNLIFFFLRRCETFHRLVVGRDLNSKNYLFESVFRRFERWWLDGSWRRCPAALGMMRAKTLCISYDESEKPRQGLLGEVEMSSEISEPGQSI